MRRTGRSSLYSAVAGLGVLGMVAVTGSPASAAAMKTALPAGMTAYGFPRVAASALVSTGSLTLHRGLITIEVPAGAVPVGARFQLLEGTPAYWQRRVPAGQQVVAEFALRVVSSSGTLVKTFSAPVKAIVRSGRVGPATLYENTTMTMPPQVVANPVAPTITGHTLVHPIKAATVGWVVADGVHAHHGAASTKVTAAHR